MVGKSFIQTTYIVSLILTTSAGADLKCEVNIIAMNNEIQ